MSQSIGVARAPILAEVTSADLAQSDQALSRVLKADAIALSVERVGFWQRSHDPFRLTLVCNYVKSSDRCDEGIELLAKDYPSYFGALDMNPVIIANDAQRDVRTAEFNESYLRPNGIVSMLDVPVWCGGR